MKKKKLILKKITISNLEQDQMDAIKAGVIQGEIFGTPAPARCVTTTIPFVC